jgi:hypothetical protein
MVGEFMLNRQIVRSAKSMLIPQIQYNTNDSWEMISGMDSGLGWPLLLAGNFAGGKLYLLTIPENFEDLYNLPEPVLNKIRETICKSFGIQLIGGSQVSLFLYDNNTFIVESFNDHAVEMEIALTKKDVSLTDLSTNAKPEMITIPESGNPRGHLASPKYGYKITLPPHSFAAYKME